MPRQKMKIDGRRKIIDHIINREKGNLTLVTQSKYKNLTLKDSVNEFKLGEKFDCQNSDTILDHMNGEWAKRNNSAVSGGHLLKGMEDKWGKAENAPADDNDITKRGIYFTNDKPNINKVTHNIYTFKIVEEVNGHLIKSPAKESTFWPINWTRDNLNRTLSNSYKLSRNDWYACKENTDNTYWYKWYLQDKTMYPLETLSVVD